jgi:hypothetical protein
MDGELLRRRDPAAGRRPADARRNDHHAVDD